MENGERLESVVNKGGTKAQGGQLEYCLTGLTPDDVITIELDGVGMVITFILWRYQKLSLTNIKGTEYTEAGIGIKALKDDTVEDLFYVIFTPEEQNIQTLGSCQSANNCWRTKLGLNALTQKFIDLENQPK